MLDHLPPRAKPGQLDEVLAAIATAKVLPATDNDRALHEAAELATRRGMVVLFGDLFGDLPAIVGGLDHLRYYNHEVIVFQILDPWERDLSVDGQIRFRDLESGETLTTQAEGIREAYRQAVEDWASTDGSRPNAASGPLTGSSSPRMIPPTRPF